MPLLLGDRAAAFLRQQLEGKGIQVHTGHGVASFFEAASGATGIRLGNGVVLEADLVLVCIGAAPNLALAQQAGLATARGIQSDACLQAAPGIFVAGDVCQAAGRPARGAVREAGAQGRLAGANAAAFAAGGAVQAFAPILIPMAVRCAGLEIHVAGLASGEGVREEPLDVTPQGGAFRAVTRHADGRIAGVQMIGTREGFDGLAGQLVV